MIKVNLETNTATCGEWSCKLAPTEAELLYALIEAYPCRMTFDEAGFALWGICYEYGAGSEMIIQSVATNIRKRLKGSGWSLPGKRATVSIHIDNGYVLKEGECDTVDARASHIKHNPEIRAALIDIIENEPEVSMTEAARRLQITQGKSMCDLWMELKPGYIPRGSRKADACLNT